MDTPQTSSFSIESLTPSTIVRELDTHIVGQDDAKRTVAIALRNRMRRRQLDTELQEEVVPKNIIMMGPTGIGKTEIARRLARLVQAPFVKVEATKYTEVGYVGRDVESMVRDLVQMSIKMIREEKEELARPEAERRARERLIELLEPNYHLKQDENGTAHFDLFRRRFVGGEGNTASVEVIGQEQEPENTPPKTTHEKIEMLLDQGHLEEHEVEIDVTDSSPFDGMIGMIGMDEQMMGGMRDMLEKLSPKKQRRRVKMTVKEARETLVREETDNLIDQDKIAREALDRAEQNGVIFIDEIDKIVSGRAAGGPDVSREGVQRDILPIVEGCTVHTKYGPIRTDYILFIAAGAFHTSKPSELIPELQGRFPLRVELKPLGAAEFERILTEPKHSLIHQYTKLLEVDGVELNFTDDGIKEIAITASTANTQIENIGARRLHTILERILEDVSFNAPDLVQGKVTIDKAYVQERLGALLKDQDLSRFIL